MSTLWFDMIEKEMLLLSANRSVLFFPTVSPLPSPSSFSFTAPATAKSNALFGLTDTEQIRHTAAARRD